MGLVVPFLALPMLASGALTVLLRWRLDGRRAGAPRLWSAGAFLAVAVVATAHFALVTRATGDLAGPELLGVAYDSLADHLLHGSSEVDRYAIRWEVFDVDGRPTMYFGPLPALLRIPAHWIAPTGYGRWSRLSCWTAALLCLLAAQLILRAPLRANPWLSPRARRAALAVSVLGFGLGTPVAFAMSAAAIYHEAPLWGLAASLFGVHFALELARSREHPGSALTGLAIAAGAALLARVTFGAIATFVDFQYLAYLAGDERSWSILQSTGTFNPDRIPTALANYFGFRPEAFMARFPFVAMIRPLHLAPDLYPTIFRETVVSLPAVSAWLVGGALFGVVGLRRTTVGWPTRGVLGVLFAQPLLVLSYYLVSQRYALDFLPFLWAAYACFLGGVGRHIGSAAAQTVLTAAVAASLFATSCATLSWIPQSRLFTPQEYKDRVMTTVGGLSAHFTGTSGP